MCRERYAELALPVPLHSTYTYIVPDRLVEKCQTGCRVEVSFQNRYLVGLVFNLSDDKPDGELKPILAVLDNTPAISEEMLNLLKWISSYYLAPIGESLRLALLPGLLSCERITIGLTTDSRKLLSGLPNEHLSSMGAKEQKGLLELLTGLPQTGTIGLAQLKKSGFESKRESLRKWEELGFIVLDSGRPGQGVRHKSVAYISVATSIEEAEHLLGRSKKQQKVFTELFEVGEISRVDFCSGDSSRSNAVRELIKKGLISVCKKIVLRNPLSDEIMPEHMSSDKPDQLWPDQLKALDKILFAVENERDDIFLLHGTTGSGKTEVYLQVAEKVISKNQSILILVPEISLTPQLVSRFEQRFQGQVALLHSSLSQGERYDEWHRIKTGEARIVVGARSAIFSQPVNMGLIIVDEEHDASYKSDSHVLYHGRDVAIMRARKLGIPVILGSATPSLESYARAKKDAYTLIKLDKPDVFSRSEIGLIDMAITPTSKRSLLSAELVLAIKDRLNKNEQVILFINRRGWAPYLICRHCKEPVRCVQCSITMAYHRTIGKLVCHSCGITKDYSETCLHCNSPDLELSGVGTQRVEDEIDLTFPEARIARLDRDIMSRKGSLHKTLAEFADGNIDILVGTQIVSKGHDFPNVTLVGVLATDHSLNIPDFRAGERTFQQLLQVAGRAGRKDKPGEVLIQTFQPGHFVLQAVTKQNFDAFYSYEMNNRSELGYPPYQRLMLLKLEGPDKHKVFERSLRLAKRLVSLADTKPYQGILVLGPGAAPVSMVRNQYRFRIMLKGQKSATLHRFVLEARSIGLLDKVQDIKLHVDVDPVSMM